MFVIVFFASFFGTTFLILFAALGGDHFRSVLQRIKRRREQAKFEAARAARRNRVGYGE